MDIHEEDAGAGVLVIVLRGRLDGTGAPELERRLIELVDSGRHRLVLDLAGLLYTNSVGIRVLLLIAKRLARVGGRLVLCAISPRVRTVLEHAGFAPIVPMHPDRESAVAAVRD